MNLGARISGTRLADLIGKWRENGSRHVAVDLGAAIRRVVLDGRLPAGTQLPAERELALALGVSRSLITTVLDSLRDKGFVASKRGAGSWVQLPKRPVGNGPWVPPSNDLYDLANAAPPAPPEVAAAYDQARLCLPSLLSDHGYHAHGLPELRERIAARYESRGLPTDPEQIVVTHGALHAFALVLRILTSPGDRVLVEHPTYPNAIDSIRAVHAQPVPVPMTANGWDLDGIEAVLRQSCPKIGYHMVDFHNPTGLQMDAADREHLASLYRRTRTMAVIDETLLELDLEGGPLMPTVASFAEDWTITIGSASKTFWGGLRLGWLRLPKHLVHRFVIGRSALDLGSPVFEQLVLAELLVDPEPGLIRQRAMFRGRRDALLDAAAEHLPSWQVRVPRGGLSLWFDLGAPIGSRLAITAEDLDVHVTPGARFSAQGGLENRLRLPFVQPEDILAEAVRRLGQAASALSPARELRSTSVA